MVVKSVVHTDWVFKKPTFSALDFSIVSHGSKSNFFVLLYASNFVPFYESPKRIRWALRQRSLHAIAASPAAAVTSTSSYHALITQKPIFKRGSWLGFDDPRFVGYENQGGEKVAGLLVNPPLHRILPHANLLHVFESSSTRAIQTLPSRPADHIMAAGLKVLARVHSLRIALGILWSMMADINFLSRM